MFLYPKRKDSSLPQRHLRETSFVSSLTSKLPPHSPQSTMDQKSVEIKENKDVLNTIERNKEMEITVRNLRKELIDYRRTTWNAIQEEQKKSHGLLNIIDALEKGIGGENRLLAEENEEMKEKLNEVVSVEENMKNISKAELEKQLNVNRRLHAMLRNLEKSLDAMQEEQKPVISEEYAFPCALIECYEDMAKIKEGNEKMREEIAKLKVDNVRMEKDVVQISLESKIVQEKFKGNLMKIERLEKEMEKKKKQILEWNAYQVEQNQEQKVTSEDEMF